MPHTSPTKDQYPWEQMSLIEPDRFQLRVTASLVGGADRASVTLELRSGASQELVGLQTFGGDLSRQALEEVLAEVARWVHGAADRLVPFR